MQCSLAEHDWTNRSRLLKRHCSCGLCVSVTKRPTNRKLHFCRPAPRVEMELELQLLHWSNKGLFYYSHTVTQMWVAGTTQTLEDRAGHALLSCQQLPASRHVCHFFAWLKTKLKRCMNSPTVTPSVILPPINQLLCACVDRKGVQLNCLQIF